MSRAPSTKGNTSPINNQIGSAYDVVKVVSDNIESVNRVGENLVYLNHYLGVYAAAPTQAPTGEEIENNDFYVNSVDKSMNYYSDGSWIQFSLDYEDFSAKVALAVSSSETAVSEAQTATEKASEAFASAVNSSSSATASAASATEAQGYLDQVSADAVAATDSATAAKQSEDNAKISETNAKASEDSASASSGSASTSAATATTKASEASASALAASNSATESSGYATDLNTAVQSASANATIASDAASVATTKADAASASATSANSSKSAAEASATSASDSATLATEKASVATEKATLASDKATVASTKAQEAEATLAAVSALFDQFGDQYLGSLASDPTVDNDGDALQNGAFYWNNTESELRFYTGSVWVSPESVANEAANQASASATSASNSAAAAAQSETSAASSRDSATSSASTATAKATVATTKAQEASDSASAASTSETNAAQSESNAASSASSAATSATNAASSASSASGSASSASSSASVATTKASEASTSAANAATSESNAATSASQASTSESNASTSASQAADSATSASGSASTATTKASEASTSASSASSSKTAAETAEANTQALFDSFDSSVASSISKAVLPEPLLDLPLTSDCFIRKCDADLIFDSREIEYAINEQGYVERFEIDHPNLTREGLLMQYVPRNRYEHPEDFSNSYWSREGNVTVESSTDYPVYLADESVMLNLNKVSIQSGATFNSIRRITTVREADSTKLYSEGVFARAGTLSEFRISLAGASGESATEGENVVAEYDLTTGEARILNAAYQVGMVPLLNGVYYCWITYKGIAAGNAKIVDLSYLGSFEDGDYLYAGGAMCTLSNATRVDYHPYDPDRVSTRGFLYLRNRQYAPNLQKNGGSFALDAKFVSLSGYQRFALSSSDGFITVWQQGGTQVYFQLGGKSISIAGSYIPDHTVRYVVTLDIVEKMISIYMDTEKIYSVSLTLDEVHEITDYDGILSIGQWSSRNFPLCDRLCNFKIWDSSLTEDQVKLLGKATVSE